MVNSELPLQQIAYVRPSIEQSSQGHSSALDCTQNEVHPSIEQYSQGHGTALSLPEIEANNVQ